MTTEDFAIVFDGPAVAEHEMGVSELASSLLALSDAMKRAAAVADPQAPSPNLKIKATAPGSFEVHLELIRDTGIIETALDLLSGRPMTAIVNVGGVLGLVGMAFGAIKLVRGRPHRTEPNVDGTVTITADNESVTLVAPAAALLEDPEFRAAATKMLDPLDSPGFDSVALRTGAGPVALVTRDERHYFTPVTPDVLLEDVVRRARLAPLGVDFGWRQWRVRDLDSQTQLRVSIEDQDFRVAVERGDLAIGKNDVLHVDLRSTEYVTPAGEIAQRHTVTNVERHERGHVEDYLDL